MFDISKVKVETRIGKASMVKALIEVISHVKIL